MKNDKKIMKSVGKFQILIVVIFALFVIQAWISG